MTLRILIDATPTGVLETLVALEHRVLRPDEGESLVAAALRLDPDVIVHGAPAPEASPAPGRAPRIGVVPRGDVRAALALLRSGAVEVLEAPCPPDEWRAALARAAAARPPEGAADHGLVGRSDALRTLREQIERVASAPRTTVLVLGESGVGKERVARAIHARSARAAGPFVAVNCATLSEELVEAELFGYEAGAFTGARSGGHAGLFEAADGGTLLLDEIGELAPALQARLLRVLEERRVRRVGGTRDVEVDVRVIACTNRDLAAEVEAGRFREDLFYRLNVMCIRVPALRERREDIAPLARHFLAEAARELDRPGLRLDAEALAALEGHSWPGNVRELKNAVERAALLAPAGALRAADLVPGAEPPAPTGGAPAALPEGEDLSLRRMEETLIRRALSLTGGNKSESARRLGVHRATLYHKLREYGIA